MVEGFENRQRDCALRGVVWWDARGNERQLWVVDGVWMVRRMQFRMRRW